MAITAGSLLNKVPSPQQQTLASNYIDFAGGSTGWEQQYLPDLMEKEAEIYGKRTISGFLAQVGAEEASASDRVGWSEQGRLHLCYTATCENTVGGGEGDVSDNIFSIVKDIDGNAIGAGEHGIRVGDTVLVSNSSLTLRGYVSVVNSGNNSITIPVSYTHLRAHETREDI